MTNRKILYGYQIRTGELEIVPDERQTVCRVFTLYNAGASYQNIADTLNCQKIPYCAEAPIWNKHKVKRLLENIHYTGRDGYPALVDTETFQAARDKTAEKASGRRPCGKKTPIARLTPYLRCGCGGKMTRLGGGWQTSGRLYLKCGTCGDAVTVDMDTVIGETARQFRERVQPEQTVYTPSAEVIRLSNSINRGLEQPDSPEAVMTLILRGASARYDCCPDPLPKAMLDGLTGVDWRRFRQTISHITVSPDGAVTLTFTDDEQTGKDG